MKRQKSEESTLRQQHTRQDAIVAELRKNGDALKSHLSRKQAEANQLRNRIAALIAEEERRAAEERALAEAQRKAEEERVAREKAEKERMQREEAERQARLLAESQAAERAAAEAEKEAAKKARKDAVAREKALAKADEKARKQAEKERKEAEKREREAEKRAQEAEKKAQEAAKKRKEDVKKVEERNYADARRRRPRSQTDGNSGGKLVAANVKPAASAGNFAQMKGSLPRPASGSFKVTSRFGRQSLPDLPDVVYDNPGIDAEVSSGASALAVYNGKVSGVYMLPGYNTVVIVNHGNYYTVYGNISTPAVKVGDQVKAGQGLGALAPDEDDRSRSSIHFEVWRNREKLNPLDWIR